MYRHFFLLVMLAISTQTAAFAPLSLQIQTITTANWHIDGIQLSFNEARQLQLTIRQIRLPKPFDELTLVNIRCAKFSWQGQTITCTQGRASVHSARWQSPSAQFFVAIHPQHSRISLSHLRLAGGDVALTLNAQGPQWRLSLSATGLDTVLMQKLAGGAVMPASAGHSDVKLLASGNGAQLEKFSLTASAHNISAQSPDGRYACENMTLTTLVNGQYRNTRWHWQNQTTVTEGSLYLEPLFLAAQGRGLSLAAAGVWDPRLKTVAIPLFTYQDQALTLSGDALVDGKQTLKLANAHVALQSNDLRQSTERYLQPFLTATAGDGLSFGGRLNAQFSIANNALQAVTAIPAQVLINDSAGRFQLLGGQGVIHWSADEKFAIPSKFAWQHLQLYQIPVDSAELVFLTRAHQIKLVQPARLPVFGGQLAVKRFAWQSKAGQESAFYFVGDMQALSLSRISRALHWTPLAGTLSGTIPSVAYRHNTLHLGGALTVKVFAGEVSLTDLQASDLFGATPQFSGDIAINKLDLAQLTSTFAFGNMTGQLSGYVRDLVMSDWQPVSFEAWLGTPKGDNTRHRISQKAVKNIASIGGGGATDILSRSFLNLFASFGYDQIGLGCVLLNGVCQLSGVSATPEGYAIITGGGLPRINVIGYNPRVDWQVLLERLNRISTSDNPQIK